MNKILIPVPTGVKIIVEGDTLYVRFPLNDPRFEQWCSDNNIGWEGHNHRYIIKSYFQVFLLNKHQLFYQFVT